MSEVEEMIARDLRDNEYNGAEADQAKVLAKSAAQRLVRMLAGHGYVIRKEQLPGGGL